MALQICYIKSCPERCCISHRKTLVTESFLNRGTTDSQPGSSFKETAAQVFL